MTSGNQVRDQLASPAEGISSDQWTVLPITRLAYNVCQKRTLPDSDPSMFVDHCVPHLPPYQTPSKRLKPASWRPCHGANAIMYSRYFSFAPPKKEVPPRETPTGPVTSRRLPLTLVASRRPRGSHRPRRCCESRSLRPAAVLAAVQGASQARPARVSSNGHRETPEDPDSNNMLLLIQDRGTSQNLETLTSNPRFSFNADGSNFQRAFFGPCQIGKDMERPGLGDSPLSRWLGLVNQRPHHAAENGRCIQDNGLTRYVWPKRGTEVLGFLEVEQGEEQ